MNKRLMISYHSNDVEQKVNSKNKSQTDLKLLSIHAKEEWSHLRDESGKQSARLHSEMKLPTDRSVAYKLAAHQVPKTRHILGTTIIFCPTPIHYECILVKPKLSDEDKFLVWGTQRSFFSHQFYLGYTRKKRLRFLRD